MTTEQEIISKKLEELEDNYLAILERGINILDLSQRASEIYGAKGDEERRALLRDLFSNLRLKDKSLDMEYTPLVAAIAKRGRKRERTV